MKSIRKILYDLTDEGINVNCYQEENKESNRGMKETEKLKTELRLPVEVLQRTRTLGQEKHNGDFAWLR